MNKDSEVDINVLVRLYNQKLAALTNQNILLEAKLQTITEDFAQEKNELLSINLELEQKYEKLLGEIKKGEK
jgi:hypothetical protein